jgi:hypothetical protein
MAIIGVQESVASAGVGATVALMFGTFAAGEI